VNGGGPGADGSRGCGAWLVGRGRHPYEAALKPPDSLADILDGDPVDGFGLDAAALRVYEEKTGMSDFYERLDREEKDLPPPPPEGADWDFEDEDEMRKRFPRLCHLYLTPAGEETEGPRRPRGPPTSRRRPRSLPPPVRRPSPSPARKQIRSSGRAPRTRPAPGSRRRSGRSCTGGCGSAAGCASSGRRPCSGSPRPAVRGGGTRTG